MPLIEYNYTILDYFGISPENIFIEHVSIRHNHQIRQIFYWGRVVIRTNIVGMTLFVLIIYWNYLISMIKTSIYCEIWFTSSFVICKIITLVFLNLNFKLRCYFFLYFLQLTHILYFFPNSLKLYSFDTLIIISFFLIILFFLDLLITA